MSGKCYRYIKKFRRLKKGDKEIIIVLEYGIGTTTVWKIKIKKKPKKKTAIRF